MIQKRCKQALKFDVNKGEIIKYWVPMKKFGPIKLKIYFFNEGAKRKYNNA